MLILLPLGRALVSSRLISANLVAAGSRALVSSRLISAFLVAACEEEGKFEFGIEVSLLDDVAPLRMRGRSLTKRIYTGSEQKQAQTKKTGGQWTDAGSRKKECPGLGGVLRRRLL